MTATWDDVRDAIDAKDPGRVAALVGELDGAGRREVAGALPGRLRELRSKSEWGDLDRGLAEPLLLAGAGTIGGAAAAASWLCRRELEPWRSGTELVEVAAARPAEWRADVGSRIADRLRVGDHWGRMRWLWQMAAAFTLSAGAEAPVSDGFVVGWIESVRPADLADTPFLDALVPRLFEADGVGAALADDSTQERWDPDRGGTWVGALTGLVDSGRLDRTTLLDGCVGRFLRGGTAHELRWFVQLHDRLEPAGEEAAARVRDYAALLPSAPSTVADLALRQVRRADGLERLDAKTAEEAAGAVLFRPEKKLVRTALTWLDRSARTHDRVDATVRAVTAVFTSDALDLRQRAVKVAVKHAGATSGDTRAEVRNAAADLPSDLRATIAAAFGAVEDVGDVAEAPPGPPAFVPRPLPAPIGSLAELAEEFTRLLHAEFVWEPTERFLTALVEHAFTDRAGTREALAPHLPPEKRSLSLEYGSHASIRVTYGWVLEAVRGLFGVHESEPPAHRWERLRGTGVDGPPVWEFLIWRKLEIAALVGSIPVLLATPTEGSGHIDPMVLIERLERLERADAEPGRADIAQALLRLPREIDSDAVIRAKGLTSGPGRTVAARLASGALPDPVVECPLLDEPLRTEGGRPLTLLPNGAATVAQTADVPSDLAELWNGRTEYRGPSFRPSAESWPALFPSHREVAAAHALPHLVRTADYANRQGATALGLAEADGPAGIATGTVLAFTLAHQQNTERVQGVEALLAFSARGALPAAELGTAIGRLANLDRITPNRAVRSLTEAADAGAHADVWTVIAAALPHLLPEPGTRAPSGLPDLLALGTRTAETVHARDTIPGLADVAARGGTSRLVTEAARLHRTLDAR